MVIEAPKGSKVTYSATRLCPYSGVPSLFFLGGGGGVLYPNPPEASDLRLVVDLQLRKRSIELQQESLQGKTNT